MSITKTVRFVLVTTTDTYSVEVGRLQSGSKTAGEWSKSVYLIWCVAPYW